jgi:DNA-binding GntR family transcriptional regulator
MRLSATQRVYEKVKQDLLAGAIAPGDRIVPDELCAGLRVSQTPVREALLALERDGLVRIVPRHGYFAREISFREALDAYQLRMILEPIATALAARRITADEIERIRELADVFTDNSEGSFVLAVERNRQFHLAIANASGNARLAKIMADLMDDIKRLLYAELRTEHTEGDWREEHSAIVDALQRHNPADAAAAVRATFAKDVGLLPLRAKAELTSLLEEVNLSDALQAEDLSS